MALYEFYCDACRAKFEQITSSTDPDQGKCPKCHTKDTRKLISRFAVGGQGDLRESTMHGCHDCEVPLGGGTGGHSESHSAPSEPASGGGGHSCGSGCSH